MFHSDDYVHFLSALTPENVDGLTNNPCKSQRSRASSVSTSGRVSGDIYGRFLLGFSSLKSD